MFSVYILFSEKLNRFYIGSTNNVDKRLIQHNSKEFDDAFTKSGIPWKITLVINDLQSKQAFDIEQHIKNMKSTKYIQNLIKYQELKLKLIERYT
jgi:putative endonuclease